MVETEELTPEIASKLDYTKESVKISRNSKGYTWEVKIVAEEGIIFSDKDFERLKALEDKIFQQYGEKLS
jgi:hypothetical protein